MAFVQAKGSRLDKEITPKGLELLHAIREEATWEIIAARSESPLAKTYLEEARERKEKLERELADSGETENFH